MLDILEGLIVLVTIITLLIFPPRIFMKVLPIKDRDTDEPFSYGVWFVGWVVVVLIFALIYMLSYVIGRAVNFL